MPRRTPKPSSEPPVVSAPEAAQPPGENAHICPSCGAVTDYRCRFCGATRSTNPVSGAVIWMRNGRVVEAFHDSLQAWIRMAERYNIREDQWPERFRHAVPPHLKSSET